MFDLLIKNGRIIDGTGSPSYFADVAIKDGKIADVKVTDHKETPGLSTPALEKIPEAIKAANDPSVDAISSATVTSKAIMNAVAKALEEAAK